jgi:hypothetical protein
MHRNAGDCTAASTESHQQLADVAEQDDATIARVSDDELVIDRTRNAAGTIENADTDVADELSVNAEHTHAAVAKVSDGDVTVARHEAQPPGVHQQAVITAPTSELTNKSAITPLEHTEEAGHRHDDDVGVRAHASGFEELPLADEAVEVEGRCQHLHAVVAVVSDEHEVVGGDAHLAWTIELQPSAAQPTDDSTPRPVRDIVLVNGMRATHVI